MSARPALRGSLWCPEDSSGAAACVLPPGSYPAWAGDQGRGTLHHTFVMAGRRQQRTQVPSWAVRVGCPALPWSHSSVSEMGILMSTLGATRHHHPQSRDELCACGALQPAPQHPPWVPSPPRPSLKVPCCSRHTGRWVTQCRPGVLRHPWPLLVSQQHQQEGLTRGASQVLSPGRLCSRSPSDPATAQEGAPWENGGLGRGAQDLTAPAKHQHHDAVLRG